MVETIRATDPTKNTSTPASLNLKRPFSDTELQEAKAVVAGSGPAGAQVVGAIPTQQPGENTLQGLTATERVASVGSKASRVLLAGETIEDVLTGGTHNHTASAKAVAGIGVAGGAVQVGIGIHQLANGKTVEGVKNTTAGGLAAAAGAVEFRATAAVAKKAVPVLAGASGVVEGVGDVVEAVRDSDVQKGVVGGAKALGGGMLAAAPFLGATFIGAPAAAIIGAVGGIILGGAEIYDAYRHFTGGSR